MAIGATRLEITVHVLTRQALPGLVTALLLAFGRALAMLHPFYLLLGSLIEFRLLYFSQLLLYPWRSFFSLVRRFLKFSVEGMHLH